MGTWNVRPKNGDDIPIRKSRIKGPPDGKEEKLFSCKFLNNFKILLKRNTIKILLKGKHTKNIVVGSSGIREKNWVITDKDTLNVLDEADWKRFFVPNSIDAIKAEHVWEHLTLEEGVVAAKICFKYLKKGGYLRIAVPDGYHTDPYYIRGVDVDGTGPGAKDHKVLYTYITLRKILNDSGFEVKFLEYFDEHGTFHFIDWNSADGFISRSKRYDRRNKDGSLHYTSIIADAIK